MRESLTILFQGPIIQENSVTYLSVYSARQSFPDAPIIISTWNGHKQFISKNLYDIKNVKFIFSEDPGAAFCKPNSPLNVNRVIVSSKNGLEKVTTDYVLKCRSDIVFKNNNVFKLYYKYNSSIKNSKLKLVSEKVLFSNQTSLNPSRIPILYHLCDWLALGRTKDVIDIFNIDLMPDKDFYWYLNNKKPEDNLTPGNLSRYMSEDYIIYMFCRKHIPECEHENYYDTDEEKTKLWLSIIADNFIILPNKMMGLYSLKYHNVADFQLWKSYSYYEWRKLANISNPLYVEFFDSIKIKFYVLAYKIYLILFNAKKISNL